jgi:hypothetical protein
MGLQDRDREKSVATEVCVRAVDARHGGQADPGQVWRRVERQFGWSIAGATRHHLPEAFAPRAGDDALVEQWLKKEYPKIKALAQREKAEIFFGDAAHMRSDHHAGRSWGKKGETPVVETTGARHGMSLISAITSRGQMRFMIKEKGGVNAAVFIEFLKRLIAGAKPAIFLIVDRGPATSRQEDKSICRKPERQVAVILSSTLLARPQSR